MAPPLEPFLPVQLEWRSQIQANGKRRKEPIELEKCALKEIVQYDCQVQYKDKNDKMGTIVCTPVTRLFRRYVYFIQTFSHYLMTKNVVSALGFEVLIMN